MDALEHLDPDIKRFLISEEEVRELLEREKRKNIKSILLEEDKEAKPFQSEIDAWEEIEKGWWLRKHANIKGRIFKPELILEEESLCYYLQNDKRLARKTTDLFAKTDVVTGGKGKVPLGIARKKVLERKDGEMI
jgi:hypothetical protein